VKGGGTTGNSLEGGWGGTAKNKKTCPCQGRASEGLFVLKRAGEKRERLKKSKEGLASEALAGKGVMGKKTQK